MIPYNFIKLAYSRTQNESVTLIIKMRKIREEILEAFAQVMSM